MGFKHFQALPRAMCMTTMVFNEFLAGLTSQQKQHGGVASIAPGFSSPTCWLGDCAFMTRVLTPNSGTGWQQARTPTPARNARTCTRQPSVPHHAMISKLIWQLWSLNDIREHEGTNSRPQFPNSSNRVSSHDPFLKKSCFVLLIKIPHHPMQAERLCMHWPSNTLHD